MSKFRGWIAEGIPYNICHFRFIETIEEIFGEFNKTR